MVTCYGKRVYMMMIILSQMHVLLKQKCHICMQYMGNVTKKVPKKVTMKRRSKKNIKVESNDFLVEEGSITLKLSVVYEEESEDNSLSDIGKGAKDDKSDIEGWRRG